MLHKMSKPRALVTGMLLSFHGAALAVPIQHEPYCYIFADSGNQLASIDKDGTNFATIGTAAGVSDIEAIAFEPATGTLWAADADQLGTLDFTSGSTPPLGTFTATSSTFGTCSTDGSNSFTVNDVDSLQFDFSTGILWGVERNSGTGGGQELLFQIDTSDGSIIDDDSVFGVNITCVVVDLDDRLLGSDIDDLGIDPEDGTFYAIANSGGVGDVLITLDPNTGNVGRVSPIVNIDTDEQLEDVEGLSFGLDGRLFAILGDSAPTAALDDTMWIVDKDTGRADQLGDATSNTDYEAIACLTDNLITGTVFFDFDEDGVFNAANGDVGYSGATVTLYEDVNMDGDFDMGTDVVLDTMTTDVNGEYAFPAGSGDFVVAVTTSTLPTGHSITTGNASPDPIGEDAMFDDDDFGEEDANNDFGFIVANGAGELDITKTSDATGPTVQGQTITYTIVVSNDSGETQTGIRLDDVLPDGVTYVPETTEVTGPRDFFVRDEFSSVAYDNDDGSVDWDGDWTENDPDDPSDPTDDPAAGEAQIVNGQLRLGNNTGGSPSDPPDIEREVDISSLGGIGEPRAFLSFDFFLNDGVDDSASDVVEIELSSNGGTSFTTIDSITGIDGEYTAAKAYDISSFASADTVVRFHLTGSDYHSTSNLEYIFIDNVEIRASETFVDQFQTAAFDNDDGTQSWATDWVETDDDNDASGGDIQITDDGGLRDDVLEISGGGGSDRPSWHRTLDLSDYDTATLSFEYRRDSMEDFEEAVTVEASTDGSNWKELWRMFGDDGDFADTEDDSDYFFLAVDLTQFVSTTTHIRFRTTEAMDGNDSVFFDNITVDARTTSEQTLDNIPGGTNRDLVNGVPSVLVARDDGFRLADGERMTATFDVVVDRPLDPWQPRLFNSALTNSIEAPVPERDHESDDVHSGAIGDFVWLDVDADGIQDVGEPGISGVTLELWDDFDSDGTLETNIQVIDGRLDIDDDGNVDTDDDGSLNNIRVIDGRLDMNDDGVIDANDDGTFEGTSVIDGELDINGVGGVTTADDDATFDFSPQATAVTGFAGEYLFDHLAPGDYFVEVDESTLPDGGTDLDLSAGMTNPSAQVSITAGEERLDVDFGYHDDANAIIGDRVWSDDGDGLQEPGEVGIANVTVSLISAGPDGIFGNGDDVTEATTTTDADGGYLFTDVDPGEYIVEVDETDTDLTGFSFVSGPHSISNASPPVNVIAGDAVLDVDFAYTNTSTFEIADRTWFDSDGDGTQDAGEPGIAGVEVVLLDDNGGVVGSTITDANGDFSFTGLLAGDYEIVIVDGDNVLTDLRGTTTFAQNASRDITIVAMDISNVSFGYNQPGAIGDRVWSDNDGDGNQDNGEPGISGVTVELWPDLDGDGVYETNVEVIDGRIDLDDDGDTDGLDDGYLAGVRIINGRLDINGDGQIDATDDGTFEGTTVIDGELDINGVGGVTGADDDATFDFSASATTVTGENGMYLFENLFPGMWFTHIDPTQTALSGYTLTTSDDDTATGHQIEVDLADSGESFLDADYGYQNTSLANISGTVFEDDDRDGVYEDATEDEFEGVTMALLPDYDGDGLLEDLAIINGQIDFDGDGVTAGDADDDGTFEGIEIINGGIDLNGDGMVDDDDDGTLRGIAVINGQFDVDGDGTTASDADDDGSLAPTPLATTVTDVNGDYTFFDLPAGDYIVAVTDDDGVVADYELTSGLDQRGVTLASTDITGIDFGYAREPGTGVIGDTVWLDTVPPGGSADGLRGPTEAGIANVDLFLFEDFDGDGVFETTIEVIDGRLDLDDDGNVDNDDNGFLNGILIINGRLDLNGDGVIDGSDDGTFGGTTVIDGELDINGGGVDATDDDASFALPARDTTTTDLNGNYLFTGLPAGQYFVDIDTTDLPPNLSATTGTTDPSDLIPLGDGERFLDADFGYVPSGSTAVIGDFIWYDDDSDGLQDPGEVGAQSADGMGIRVTLIGSGGDGTFNDGNETTTTVDTGPDGMYLFTNVAPDDYLLDFDRADLPAGYNTDPTNTGADSTYNVTVAAGDVITFVDWGIDGGTVGSIGDFVWLDSDGDGVQDSGEQGIADVTLNLLNDNGDVIGTTITDVDGNYLFTGVVLGDDYTVEVTDLNGVLADLNLSTALPGTLSPTGGTPDILTADFGYAPSDGFGSIGNAIWYDQPGGTDGLKESGEPPIEGVTLDIWLDIDDDGVIDPGTDNLVRTVITDQNGNYEVKTLPLGNYLVDVTDDFGVLGGLQKTSGTADTDNNSQADPYAVTLTSGAPNVLYADFGYEDDTVNPLAISGTVFIDESNFGTFDSGTEPTVEFAVLTLYRLVNGTRVRISSATSDGNGDYSFDDLPPGSYEIEVSVIATDADGFLQTTQTTTGGVQSVTLVASDSTDNDFGFYDGGTTTTPVSLASFSSTVQGSQITIAWTTENEVANVGFAIYGEDAAGTLFPIGADLDRLFGSGFEGPTANRKQLISQGLDLIPARAFDSMTPSAYRVTTDRGAAKQYWLVDLDLAGRDTWHGPFEPNRRYGGEPRPAAIDWVGIQQESAFERNRRHGNRRGTSAVEFAIGPTGLYRVTFNDLDSAGMGIRNVPIRQLILTDSRGVEIPMHVTGGSDVMRQGVSLTFYAEGLETLYTDTNAYRLTRVAGGDGLRASESPVLPGPVVDAWHLATAQVRERNQYNFSSLDDDPWFMDRLLDTAGGAAISYTITTDHARGGDAVFAAELMSVTDFPGLVDHNIDVVLNGQLASRQAIDGAAIADVALAVADGQWLPGENQVDIMVRRHPAALYSLVNTQAVSLTYPRDLVATGGFLDVALEGAFAPDDSVEVHGFDSPDILVYAVDQQSLVAFTGAAVQADGAGFSVLVPEASQGKHLVLAEPGAIRTPTIAPLPFDDGLDARPAEYLVISHPDFIDGIAPLVQFHQDNGMSVDVVDVEALYRRYTGGVVDPDAIDRYIEESVATRGTRYVLLNGGDSYDYRDDLGQGAVSFLPSYYRRTGPLIRFTPTDVPYADVDGDDLPDVALGRFPVRSGAELAAMVVKTLQFASKSYDNTAVFASDNTDRSGRFGAESDALMARLSGQWSTVTAELDVGTAAFTRSVIIGEIEQGVALTSYFGHSGPTVWAMERLFSATDAQALNNAGRPTAVIQWGCWNTYFASPFAETLAHRLLLSGEHGAAVVLGASTLTRTHSDRFLGRELMPIATESGIRVGDALTLAKQSLAVDKIRYADVLFGFSLLGDPALVISP